METESITVAGISLTRCSCNYENGDYHNCRSDHLLVTSSQSKWKTCRQRLLQIQMRIIESSALAGTQATTPILVLIVNPLGLNLHWGRKQDPPWLRLYRTALLILVNVTIFIQHVLPSDNFYAQKPIILWRKNIINYFSSWIKQRKIKELGIGQCSSLKKIKSYCQINKIASTWTMDDSEIQHQQHLLLCFLTLLRG